MATHSSLHTIDLSRRAGARRSFVQALVSFAGAGGIALLVPLAMLAIGLPIALAARGLVEVIGWMLSAVGR